MNIRSVMQMFFGNWQCVCLLIRLLKCAVNKVCKVKDSSDCSKTCQVHHSSKPTDHSCTLLLNLTIRKSCTILKATSKATLFRELNFILFIFLLPSISSSKTFQSLYKSHSGDCFGLENVYQLFKSWKWCFDYIDLLQKH